MRREEGHISTWNTAHDEAQPLVQDVVAKVKLSRGIEVNSRQLKV